MNKMKFNKFVDENYNVLDISKRQKEIIKSIIKTSQVDDTLYDHLKNLLLLDF